jgi:formylglycine-generating enzyme required for sulfatase activity
MGIDVRRLSALAVLLALFVLRPTPAAEAVTMDWTFVGNPGNACETQTQGCFGAVGYEYQIGTYEVTNAQYAEFLNAKAASDPLALYNTGMGNAAWPFTGGITRSGSSGSFTYSVIAGRGEMPVNWVTVYDTMRFANWMNNGQGSSDTETGAYTLLGGTAIPSNALTVTRNAGATIALSSEDEWYKAAYYSAISTSYLDYPAGSNTVPTCATPTATANRANCNAVVNNLTIKGSYTGSASPYGTFDQAGNLFEWNEALSGSSRVYRGGYYGSSPVGDLAASTRLSLTHTSDGNGTIGFRLTAIPEPATGSLLAMGMLGLAGLRRQRSRSSSRTPTV